MQAAAGNSTGGRLFTEVPMSLTLSPRLQACCNFIAPGDRVADVGTDHGYLGIWLLQQGIARSVIASDIVPGPLSAAQHNVEKYGFTEQMQCYLSDGVRSIPRDFDTLVCAGMGGDTIISILGAAHWLKDSKYRLVLQSQSKTPLLRRYITDRGWRIAEESVVRDGRFLYTVMEVWWDPGHKLTPGQWYFPPALLENPSVELPAYYRRVITSLHRAIDGQKDHADPILITALNELENDPDLQWLKEDSHDACS